jgi:hypothetical protein
MKNTAMIVFGLAMLCAAAFALGGCATGYAKRQPGMVQYDGSAGTLQQK